MKNKYGMNCHNKDFRYPFILPLVYYEGKGTWTADLHLHSRLPDMGDALKKYIPDFSYQVVRIRDYPNQDLLEKGDGMSLLMIPFWQTPLRVPLMLSLKLPKVFAEG